MQRKFQTGDKVKLISGGPAMTVLGYDPIDGLNVTCHWFSKDNIIEKSFHQNMLESYNDLPLIGFGFMSP